MLLERCIVGLLLASAALAAPALAQFAQPGCCQGPTGGCLDVPFEGECIPPLANQFFPGSACDHTTGLCGAPAVCGNGARETGEQCDDGNLVGGDGCSSVCGVEGAVPPQSELRVEASGEFGGVQGTVSCIAGALDPNPLDLGCFDPLPGHAEGEAFVLQGPRSSARGAEARARARFPGSAGAVSRGTMLAFQGVRRPATRVTAQATRIARYIATYTGSGTPPASISNDLLVHLSGALRTGRSTGTRYCQSSCPASVPPDRGDVVASVTARIDVYQSSGVSTVLEATADLGVYPASLTIPLFNVFGPWDTSFDVRPGVGGAASVADVVFVRNFPASYSVPLGQIFAIELVLRTEVLVGDPPVRFDALVAEADFMETAAIEVRTSVPDVTITMLDTDGSALPPEDQDGDGLTLAHDNCLATSNPDQADADGDGIGDACDNCPATAHSGQADSDRDGLGDVCDTCAFDPNVDQLDGDDDGVGDACESLSPFHCDKTKSSRDDTCTDDAPANAGRPCEQEEECGGVDGVSAFCVPRTFPRNTSVNLTDAWETAAFIVEKPLRLCNPADTNGDGTNDQHTHLRAYQIKKAAKVCVDGAPMNEGAACRRERDCGGAKTTRLCQRPAVARSEVTSEVTDRFGTIRVDASKADRLLLPTSADLTEPVAAPDASGHRVDRFKCYAVKLGRGQVFAPVALTAVADRFQPPKLYDVVKPTRLCNAVEQDGASVESIEHHLTCYQVKLSTTSPPQPKHVPVRGIFIASELGRERVDTVAEDELCVPATAQAIVASETP